VSVEFLITTLIVVAIPGTGVICTLAASPSRGRRAGLIAAVWIYTSGLFHTSSRQSPGSRHCRTRVHWRFRV